jgi:hypothetical protein
VLSVNAEHGRMHWKAVKEGWSWPGSRAP